MIKQIRLKGPCSIIGEKRKYSQSFQRERRYCLPVKKYLTDIKCINSNVGTRKQIVDF